MKSRIKRFAEFCTLGLLALLMGCGNGSGSSVGLTTTGPNPNPSDPQEPLDLTVEAAALNIGESELYLQEGDDCSDLSITPQMAQQTFFQCELDKDSDPSNPEYRVQIKKDFVVDLLNKSSLPSRDIVLLPPGPYSYFRIGLSRLGKKVDPSEEQLARMGGLDADGKGYTLVASGKFLRNDVDTNFDIHIRFEKAHKIKPEADEGHFDMGNCSMNDWANPIDVAGMFQGLKAVFETCIAQDTAGAIYDGQTLHVIQDTPCADATQEQIEANLEEINLFAPDCEE